ncbi:MAG: class I SAM-dependent methyltransferase [Deltaproteobacteria bacterium]|nr:class I SAM-dependent methyltransferase [Deltaproteobacteria bacterium]
MDPLYTENGSKDFYENRYLRGYMEDGDWPKEHKRRIYELIRGLGLPAKGEALDFGCGNGVFTIVLKSDLPGWGVFGCDISETAVKNASKNIVDCTFFTNNDPAFRDKRFDFVFSHHVLEHVFDIKAVVFEIGSMSARYASMLHIFPCGNPGSFEYQLCGLRPGGIEKNKGNRFFFEDDGHVRRLTSQECALLFNGLGFVLKKEFFANHYWGSINWITRSHPCVFFKMFNPIKGMDLNAKVGLLRMLLKFSPLWALRMPSVIYEYSRKKNGRLISSLSYLPSRLAMPLDRHLASLSEKKWQERMFDKKGSVMYLYLYEARLTIQDNFQGLKGASKNQLFFLRSRRGGNKKRSIYMNM